jgi:mono/diheme cytochrome c family protein
MSRMTKGTIVLWTTGIVCVAVAATSLTGSAQNAPAKPSVPAPAATPAAPPPAGQTKAAPRTTATTADAHTAVVKQYCVTCHNDRRKAGTLSLEQFEVAKAGERAETAERMIVKLQASMMPPPGARRPEPAVQAALVEAIETSVDTYAAAHPNPGVRTFQRLNRPEYARAVKELLDLDVDAGSWLPLDTKSANFDNIADAQALSPTLLEAYLNAASAISRMAVGDRQAKALDATYSASNYASQHPWDHVDGTPFGTRGGMAVSHVFPADGEYVFTVALNSGDGSRYEDIDISVDGERIALLAYETLPAGGADGRGAVEIRTEPILIKAGQHRVAAAFVKKLEGPYEDLIRPHDWSYAGGGSGGGGITNLPHLRDVIVSGPYKATGVSETPARQKIFTCRPTSGDEELRCAREILTRLATEAYRRPVTLREIDRLMPFYQQGASKDGFEGGVRTALEAILASPYFIFRLEREPGVARPGTAYRVSDVDLASRLSFFLWGTPPDDELIAAATSGKLATPLGFDRQVKKMLADPRAEALGTRFAAQWLRLQDIDKVHPDPNFYPNFDNNLADYMRQETIQFFNTIVQEDRSMLDLYRADFTILNERLARHYGIPGVSGPQFRKVQYPDDTRRGLLGQGSVLVQTSLANRTSPVLRGKWVMEVLLGTPPPPPPPDVPALEETSESKNGKMLTTRERMEMHRANPTCNSCHRMMDPIGLALDNFDVTARWRVRENGIELDTRGDFYDGTPVTKPAELVAALLKRPEPLVRTFTENLLAYALGRRVEYFDQPAIRAIARAAQKDDYRMSALILGVVKSDAFRMKKAEPNTSTTEETKSEAPKSVARK